jgi:predicted acyltransferase
MMSRDSTREPLISQTSGEEIAKPIGKARLVSLDVIRGVTIALMIFVDYCGQVIILFSKLNQI